MYESPIEIIQRDIANGIQVKMENDICNVICSYGINVNREELIKALNYDRQQYEKGYSDRGKMIVPVVLEMNEGHTIRQINAYLDKTTQTIYSNSITVECAEAVGWQIKEQGGDTE